MKTYNHVFEVKNLKKNMYELVTNCPVRKQLDYSSMRDSLHIVSEMKVGSQQCQKCTAFVGINFSERIVACSESFDEKEGENDTD